MDAITIVILIAAAGLAAAITYVAISRKAKKATIQSSEHLERAAAEAERYKAAVASLEENLAKAKEEHARVKEEHAKAVADLEKKQQEIESRAQKMLEGHVDETVKEELAQVAALKKKVSDLQDEMEDYEDDISNLKKKLKAKSAENEDLQDKVAEAQRSAKQLSEELDGTKTQLDEKKKEVELKEQSLYFVKEILTAKHANDTDTQEKFSRIENIVAFIESDLHDALKATGALSDEIEKRFFGDALKRWEIISKKSWIQDKTTVALVGEFSAGKTSIVNRILSQDNPEVPRLPESTKATTAIPTYISGGKGTHYHFVTPSNDLKTLSEKTFKRVNKEVLDQVSGVSALIQYFVMKYENPNLEKMSILDTPGFSSNDAEDAARTIGVINECDALFWVVDVNNGDVNRASVDLIKQHLTKPLYVVINKVDTKASSEVDKVEERIRKTMKDANLSIEGVIRFSKKAPLKDIMEPIRSIPHDASKDKYLDSLGEYIKAVVEFLNSEWKKAKEECDELVQRGKNLENAYQAAMAHLQRNCEEVKGIPQYSEHWFKDNNYEMSESQHFRMSNLLDAIAGSNCRELCGLHDRQMEVRGEIETKWSEREAAKDRLQQIKDCEKAFNKKKTGLK